MGQIKNIFYLIFFLLIFSSANCLTRDALDLNSLSIDPFELYKVKYGFMSLDQNFKLKVLRSETGTHYQEQDMRLYSRTSGEIRFSVKSPVYAHGPLPVIVVFAGYGIKHDVFKLIPEHGNNILIFYEFPEVLKEFRNVFLALEVFRTVPYQISLFFNWLQEQTWADPHRINAVGVSFGGILSPLYIRLVQDNKVSFCSTTLAYTGASIENFLSAYIIDKFKKPYLNPFMNLLKMYLYDIEPRHHAPYIQSKTLLVSGSTEPQFAKNAFNELVGFITAPKDIKILPGDHITTGKPEIINTFFKTLNEWLIENQCVN